MQPGPTRACVADGTDASRGSVALLRPHRVQSTACSKGLRRDEFDDFLLHRFGSLDSRRLPVSLRDELFERARGIPALVDGVARHALASAGKAAVGDEHLRGALDAAAL